MALRFAFRPCLGRNVTHNHNNRSNAFPRSTSQHRHLCGYTLYLHNHFYQPVCNMIGMRVAPGDRHSVKGRRLRSKCAHPKDPEVNIRDTGVQNHLDAKTSMDFSRKVPLLLLAAAIALVTPVKGVPVDPSPTPSASVSPSPSFSPSPSPGGFEQIIRTQ